MFAKFVRVLIMLSLAMTSLAFASPDRAGCADHPLFPTRMPDYFISDCQSREFDAYDFFVSKGPKHREEGKFHFITYRIDRSNTEQSGLAVVRNYENAITRIGGTIVASDPQRWVNGKVTVDGKAVVKPESKAALEEVAKLLKADAALKLWVVGHTDSVGKVDDNMKLAQARAEAVTAELTGAYGIAAARLKGYGVGPLSPVAGNDSDDGRAKNRRVDLVKQP